MSACLPLRVNGASAIAMKQSKLHLPYSGMYNNGVSCVAEAVVFPWGATQKSRSVRINFNWLINRHDGQGWAFGWNQVPFSNHKLLLYGKHRFLCLIGSWMLSTANLDFKVKVAILVYIYKSLSHWLQTTNRNKHLLQCSARQFFLSDVAAIGTSTARG